MVLLIVKDQGDEGVDTPRHVAVDSHLVIFGTQVRVSFARHAEQIELRMHGDVHAPFFCVARRLRETCNAVLGAAQVALVRLGLQGPATIVMRSHHEATVLVWRLAVSGHVAVLIRSNVAAQMALQKEHVGIVTILLQSPDLLLFHARS